MLDYDDLLQKKLDELESGAPLDSLFQGLPAEAKELEPLIRLAAAVRSVPHPEPAAGQVAAQRQQVLAAAVRNTQPAFRRPVQKNRVSWNWLTAGALLAGAGAMAVILALVLVGAGFWGSNGDMNSARVEYLNGQVQVATSASGAQWKNISAGARLHRGDRLRTLGASNATLVYFEGSHTCVSPNSDLTIAELSGSSGSTLQVRLNQAAGETWNKVTPFKGNPKSFFLVQTPSGTASVHGTSFNVRVSQTGQAQFSVNTGEVRVKNDGNQVTLQAGQTTSADPSGEISAPAYLFNIQGSIIAVDETAKVWTVSGVQIQAASAAVTVEPQLGKMVLATGYILDSGAWVADTIAPGTDEGQASYFTGPLEKNDSGSWQIGGREIKVTQETQLAANLATGEPVKVTYNILADGSWLALKIESLVESPAEPEPTPTATADPNARPSYAFEPAEIETPGCGGSDFSLTGSLRNTAGEPKDYAANVQLGYLIDRGGEYVSAIELDPSGWTRIDSGQTASFTVRVTMNDQWAAASGKDGDGAQVKLRIFIASATNRPDHLGGSLTVTLTAGCKTSPTQIVTATATPTGTLIPDDTASPTIMPTAAAPAAEGAQSGQCTGANPHPTGMNLAQRYGVPYEEIMGWFCQHYGFGEIDLAYSLSRQTSKPVEEIFAMRASGMGWGEIQKALQNDSNQSQNTGQDENGKNKDKDKDNKKKK